MSDPVDADRATSPIPSQQPLADEPLYICELPGGIGTPSQRANEIVAACRIYCEKCKRAYPGALECPGCGWKIGCGAHGVCSYCGATYRYRKSCPACQVDLHSTKATKAKSPRKAIEHWQAAYAEARSNGYHFAFSEHSAYAIFLINAGREGDARRILDQLFPYCEHCLSSGRWDQSKYSRNVSYLEAIKKRERTEKGEPRKGNRRKAPGKTGGE